MVSESVDDVEGELLERIRGLPGATGIPICGVLDLHANFTQRMADHSDGLIAYRENPHTDARIAAEDAATLLERLMRTGERPITVWEHPPIMWPPTGTGTDDEPMRSLESLARELERGTDDVLAVNVLGGFAFSEVPETGLSFTAITLGDPASARASLRRLSELAFTHRELGCRSDLSVSEVMRRLARHNGGPVVLAEPSDNIGGGAPGDGVGLLRALIEHKVRNAAVVINDPSAVTAAERLRKGERAAISIGGKGYSYGTPPLVLDVGLVSTSPGRFTLEDPKSHLASMVGSDVDMGPCAVVRHNGVTILLYQPEDPDLRPGPTAQPGYRTD
jgi:microcystin degradation protein MlrC